MSEPETSDLIAAAIERLALILARQRGLGDVDPIPLPGTQKLALALIIAHQPLHLHELAQLMSTTAATATRTIDALESQSLATRIRDPDDGRAVLVSSTPQGRHVVDESRRRLTVRLRSMLEELPPDDQKRLVTLLLDLNTLLQHSTPVPGDRRD